MCEFPFKEPSRTVTFKREDTFEIAANESYYSYSSKSVSQYQVFLSLFFPKRSIGVFKQVCFTYIRTVLYIVYSVLLLPIAMQLRYGVLLLPYTVLLVHFECYMAQNLCWKHGFSCNTLAISSDTRERERKVKEARRGTTVGFGKDRQIFSSYSKLVN